MNKILKKEAEKLANLIKEFEKRDFYAAKLYDKLSKQKEAAQSKALNDSLDAEIQAYYALNAAFEKYFRIQGDFTNKHNESLQKIRDSGAQINIVQHQTMYLLNNFLPTNLSIKLYIQAISRDFKDWKKFKQMLIKGGVDIATSNIPFVSNIKSVLGRIDQIKDLVDEYKDDGTDYSDVDRKLIIIEVHTEIMNAATQQFLYQADILGENFSF